MELLGRVRLEALGVPLRGTQAHTVQHAHTAGEQTRLLCPTPKELRGGGGTGHCTAQWRKSRQCRRMHQHSAWHVQTVRSTTFKGFLRRRHPHLKGGQMRRGPSFPPILCGGLCHFPAHPHGSLLAHGIAVTFVKGCDTRESSTPLCTSDLSHVPWKAGRGRTNAIPVLRLHACRPPATHSQLGCMTRRCGIPRAPPTCS